MHGIGVLFLASLKNTLVTCKKKKTNKLLLSLHQKQWHSQSASVLAVSLLNESIYLYLVV